MWLESLVVPWSPLRCSKSTMRAPIPGFRPRNSLPRSANHHLVLGKSPFRRVVERFAAVRLHLGVVFILMQDKEVDLIPTNHSIHDLVSRFARPSLDRASNRVAVLAKYEDTLATRGPVPGQVGQQRNRNQNEQHTRSGIIMKSFPTGPFAARQRTTWQVGLFAYAATIFRSRGRIRRSTRY